MLHQLTLNKHMIYSFLFSAISSYAVYCALTQQFYLVLNENSVSSFAYAMVDTHITMKVPLMVLSVASFNLWTHDNTPISFIDVTSIFWTIIATTLYMIPNNRRLLSVVNIGFVAFIVGAIAAEKDKLIVAYYTEHLILLNALIYSLCTLITASIYGRDRHFQIGTFLAGFGYICKLLFIFKKQWWGTCAFHTISALGIHFLLQTSKSSRPIPVIEQLKNIAFM
jgi:hypothetical protein